MRAEPAPVECRLGRQVLAVQGPSDDGPGDPLSGDPDAIGDGDGAVPVQGRARCAGPRLGTGPGRWNGDHRVARDDIRWMLALTAPRVHRHNGPRYRELGLDGKTLARCESVMVSALEGGTRLTRQQIERLLKDRRIDTSGQRIAYMLLHGE